MKMLILTLFTLFSVHVNADQISDLLSQYDSVDLNGKCSVRYEKRSLYIDGSNVREGFMLPIYQIDFVNGDLVGRYGHYDGTGEVLFMVRTYSLLVVGIWEDNDNSFDKSSFCELQLKK